MDRQTSSYLGASSIKAALLVMLKVQPQLKDSLSQPLTNFETTNNLSGLQQRIACPKENCRIPWSWKGQTLIDAYFKRVHVFVPMLDEPSFRADCLGGQRCDSPWLGLLNMVFAMGSIAAMKSDDFSHFEYYHKAMEHLTIDSLGSSHIEIVQALALLGGYYLHYVNRPNMANAVLGAALRTASALGLHRQSQTPGSSDGAAVEVRRRTWWSLICLDTWATTTLGRPSLGRWGPEVNIRPPEVGVDEGHDSAQHVGILPLVENIKFCQIATQVQDMLAVAPLLKTEDRRNMNAQLINWYNNLPWLLRSNDPCAEPLYLSRCVMKWRYQNLRMLLHRPILLSMATNGANSHAGENEIAAVETCRELAKATIDEISREWARNQMSGWNAVWFLYQAVMVPLNLRHKLRSLGLRDISVLPTSVNRSVSSAIPVLRIQPARPFPAGIMDTVPICNNLKCRTDLGDRALVTSCGHIFCIECAHRTGLAGQDNERRTICPACNCQFNSPDDVIISNLNPSDEYKTTVLSGLNPSVIMECAGRALGFWTFQTTQQTFYQQHLYKTLNEKFASAEDDKSVSLECRSFIAKLTETDLAAEQGVLRRKNMDILQAYKEKSRKLLHIQELYDKVKRKAEMGDIQQAASDAVDSSLQVPPRTNHGFGVMGVHELGEGNTMPAFGQSHRFDMAGMNTGLPRSHATLSRDDNHWPRLGGATHSDLSSTPIGGPRHHGFANSSLINRTSSLPALVGTPAPVSGAVRGTTAPSFANNRVGLAGVGLTSGLKWYTANKTKNSNSVQMFLALESKKIQFAPLLLNFAELGRRSEALGSSHAKQPSLKKRYSLMDLRRPNETWRLRPVDQLGLQNSRSSEELRRREIVDGVEEAEDNWSTLSNSSTSTIYNPRSSEQNLGSEPGPSSEPGLNAEQRLDSYQGLGSKQSLGSDQSWDSEQDPDSASHGISDWELGMIEPMVAEMAVTGKPKFIRLSRMTTEVQPGKLDKLDKLKGQVSNLRTKCDTLRGEMSNLQRLVDGMRWVGEDWLGKGPNDRLTGAQAVLLAEEIKDRALCYEQWCPQLRVKYDTMVAEDEARARIEAVKARIERRIERRIKRRIQAAENKAKIGPGINSEVVSGDMAEAGDV
ncbi:hypothetical protein G7Z17_g8858 [Cylindrodendrum hubeiense]|uniref:RING-type domain-containing protein n=1 Tax=Cylindrodendrum hubeiense TaxID=595255 RepID=A0A9P5H1B5_9HYPO|nr:hypothetical protein G7Z17_g8858 [Cylindrodendrum hubeiense]